MMSFIGISIAQILVIGPFDGAAAVPQTESIPRDAMLPDLLDSRIHVGVILALVVCVVVHLVFSRTSFGTRLDVLGANPRAALHLGIDVPRLIVVAFLISGALIGLAAATDIQGELAYMRADWNPAYGLAVVPLVFLARLNALALVPVALFFTMLSVGGLYAAREARLPTDFVLLFMGILLLFMVGTQYLGDRLARGERLLRWGGPKRV
jgi:simple sugar transport system permease protein